MRKILVAALAVAATALWSPAAASAAPPPAGGLEPLSCTAQPAYAALLGCASGTPALESMHDLALSPDGRQLYAVGEGPELAGAGRVITYAVDPASGALTLTGCRGPVAAGCVEDLRLGAAGEVAVAPDGSDVYVLSYDTGIVQYRRDASGGLTFAACITPTAVGGCTAAQGINGGSGIAVSPDGAHVYVAGYNDSSLAAFDRNPSNGGLTWKECVTTGGAAGCVDVAGTAGAGALDQATDVAVAPGGGRVVASARQGDSVTTFARGAGGELLSPLSLSGDFVEGAQTVVATEAGAYAGLFDGGGLTTLAVDGAGAPSLVGCLMATASPPCAASPGVDAVFGLALAPTGDVLYAAARNGSTVSAFRRGAGGVLSLVTCSGAEIPSEGVPLEAGCSKGPGGLVGAEAVEPSADGRFVYAAASLAVTTLRVEHAPACAPLTRRVPNDRPTVVRVACSDVDRLPLSYSLTTQPSHGSLSVVAAATGRLRYTPRGRFAGRTSFGFAASDGTNAGAATGTLVVYRTRPRVAIPARRLRLTAGGALKVELRCANEPRGCRGRLVARSTRKLTLRLRSGRLVKRHLVLGSARVRNGSARARKVTIAVPRSARQAVADAGALRVTLIAKVTDAGGSKTRKVKRVTVLPPRS